MNRLFLITILLLTIGIHTGFAQTDEELRKRPDYPPNPMSVTGVLVQFIVKSKNMFTF